MTPVDKAIAILNELHEADPSVMQQLVFHRVACNDAVANHPTIQVGLQHGQTMVGILGIINGLFGVKNDGTGYIAANFDKETGQIINFSRTVTKEDDGNS